jgi:predicted DsbA family dithiol-disulfide isomerase
MSVLVLQQGKFWDMHDRLFAQQQSHADIDLFRHAETVGIDSARFKTCLESDVVSEKVQKDRELAMTLGIRSTPQFLIGEILTDGRSWVGGKFQRAS